MVLCLFTAFLGRLDVDFPYNNTRFIFLNLVTNMYLPIVFIINIVDILVGEEKKNRTIKNSIAFGIGRDRIYLGKIIIGCIISIITLIILLPIIIAITYFTMENSGLKYLQYLFQAIIGALPLWITSLIIYNAFKFKLDSNKNATMFFVLYYILPYNILNLIGMKFDIANKINLLTPMGIFNSGIFQEGKDFIVMYWNSPKGLIISFAISIFWSLLFGYIGYNNFKTKDLK